MVVVVLSLDFHVAFDGFHHGFHPVLPVELRVLLVFNPEVVLRDVSGGWVLALSVPSQVDLSLEGLLAEAARERLVARVFSHVGYQVRALAEGFPADDAFVRLLSWKGIIKINKRFSLRY